MVSAAGQLHETITRSSDQLIVIFFSRGTIHALQTATTAAYGYFGSLRIDFQRMRETAAGNSASFQRWHKL